MSGTLSSNLKEPLSDKKNIFETSCNSTKTFWFSKLQETECEKIQVIEEKYRKMLDSYEKKKKEISKELETLNKKSIKKSDKSALQKNKVDGEEKEKSKIKNEVHQTETKGSEEREKEKDEIMRRRNYSVSGI